MVFCILLFIFMDRVLKLFNDVWYWLNIFFNVLRVVCCFCVDGLVLGMVIILCNIRWGKFLISCVK